MPVVLGVDGTEDRLHSPLFGACVVLSDAHPQSQAQCLDFLLGSQVVEHDPVAGALHRDCAKLRHRDFGILEAVRHCVRLVEHVATEHKVRGLLAVVDERRVLYRERTSDLQRYAPVDGGKQVARADEGDRAVGRVGNVAIPIVERDRFDDRGPIQWVLEK